MRFTAALLCLVSACAYDALGPDGVEVDGEPDASIDSSDAGADAGEVDGGEVDAGEVDAGEVDAGEVDAGDAGIVEDAGTNADEIARACATAGWDCGTGVLSVNGASQQVTCPKTCGEDRFCVAHRCRCEFSLKADVFETTNTFADEPPSVVAGTGDQVFVAQGYAARTVLDVRFSPTDAPATLNPTLTGNTTPGIQLLRPSIALLSDGRRVMVAKETGATMRQAIHDGTTWRQAQDVSSKDGREVAEAQVIAGASGGARIFALSTTPSTRLELATLANSLQANGAFVDRTVSSDRPAFDFHLARRPDGSPRVAIATRGGGAVNVAQPEGSAFTFKSVEALVNHARPRLTYGPDGSGWLLAQRTVAPTTVDLYWRHFDEATSHAWQKAEADAIPDAATESYDLAMDTTGALHVAWSAGGVVEYAVRAPEESQWYVEEIGPGRYPRLAADGAGNVHLVYRSKSGTSDALRWRWFCK